MIGNHASPDVQQGLITALDIGTDKVCCLIGAPLIGADNGLDPSFELVGIGHRASRGIKSGMVIDPEAAESSIRAAVEIAEQMAGENIHKVYVGLNISKSISKLITLETVIDGRQVDNADLKRVLDPSALIAELHSDHELIHAVPIGYALDGMRGIRDPRGMHGSRLSVNLHMISSSSGPIENLKTAVGRCHLEVERFIVSSFASALATLAEDEAKLGAICIDMGSGTTSVSVFFDNELIYACVIPVGGGHVTNDIARGLSTPLLNAERMKTLYGNCFSSTSDDMEVIQVPLIGEDESSENHVPRRMLIEIIRPRIEEIFELISSCLVERGLENISNRVVLTGGGAQLPGVIQCASQILGKKVRVACPRNIKGMADAITGPPFSVALGILHSAFLGQKTQLEFDQPIMTPNSHFGKISQWLRENF